MTRAVLCDIEGTTTSLSFVHDVLFPISRERMDSFIHDHWSEIQSLVKDVGSNPKDVTATLRTWIDEDRKDGVLKQIQGKIWRDAFESGAIRAHVYPDVRQNWMKWNERGIRIYIFSSGSVEAQKLLFGHTEEGDLTQLIDDYFDTTTGAKKNAHSYKTIAAAIQLQPDDILFLSDVEDELDAAQTAGMLTTKVERASPPASDRSNRPPADVDVPTTFVQKSEHTIATTFDDVAI